MPKEKHGKSQIEFVNTGSHWKETALHIAARAGFENTVKTLVSIGADLNQRNNTKQTLLHLAAINGQLSIVKCLVMNKANVNAKDEDLMTPLHR